MKVFPTEEPAPRAVPDVAGWVSFYALGAPVVLVVSATAARMSRLRPYDPIRVGRGCAVWPWPPFPSSLMPMRGSTCSPLVSGAIVLAFRPVLAISSKHLVATVRRVRWSVIATAVLSLLVAWV